MNNKNKLINTFNYLMETHYLDEINVSLITKHANISRTEFYRYFKDKYDLMNFVYLDAIEKRIANSEDKNWTVMTKYCYEFMYQRKPFFSKIVKYKNQNSFMDFMFEYSVRKTVESMCEYKKVDHLDFDIELAVKLYCAGCGYILEKWLENGLKESPEQMCKAIYGSVPKCLSPYFDGLQLKEN